MSLSQQEIFTLRDQVDQAKRAYYQNTGTYDEMYEAARVYLTAVRVREISRVGKSKARTRVTPQAIAALLR